MAIVTPEQINSALGLTVTVADIAKATMVIETVTGADLTSPTPEDRFSARDLRYLSQSVTWQVAYLDTNKDVTTAQSNLASASTNGVAVSYTSGPDADAGYLAPLAEMSLNRLSWNKSRKTVHVGLDTRTHINTRSDQVDDDLLKWSPL